MKNKILRSITWLTVWMACLTSVSAQSGYTSLTQRTEASDWVVEGKIIQSESRWNVDSSFIYTTHKVIVSKLFKGEGVPDTLTMMTPGGEVDDYFISLAHRLPISRQQEGIFFLEELSVNGESRIFPRQEPIRYQVMGDRIALAKDRYQLYRSLQRDIYQSIEQATGQRYQRLGLNSAEQVRWQVLLLEQIEAANSVPQPIEITYSFRNIHYSGPNSEYIEFDVYAECNCSGDEFGNAVMYIDYNASTFGSNVAGNGDVEVTEGLLIQSPDYTLTVSDETFQKIKIQVAASAAAANLSPIDAIPREVVHVKFNIANWFSIGEVSFDEGAMQNGSDYYEPANNTFQLYAQVHAQDEIKAVEEMSAAAVGIEYSFDNVQVTGAAPQFLEFDLMAAATDPNTLYSDGSVYLKYNPAAFGPSIHSAGKVTLSLGAQLIPGNHMLFPSDEAADEFQIVIFANDSLGLNTLPTSPTQLVHVSIELADCSQPVGLAIDTAGMAFNSIHYTGQGPLVYEAYDPVIGEDTDNTVACPGNDLFISDLSPLKLAGGVGDTLIIQGGNFGNVPGKVFFKNAESIANPGEPAYMEVPAFYLGPWSDNEIRLAVPSSRDDGETASSGLVIVEANGTADRDTSLQAIEVEYAVNNVFRNSTQEYFRVNLADRNSVGGYTVDLDTSITNRPGGRECVELALEIWQCNTRVNFVIGDTVSNNSGSEDAVTTVFMLPGSSTVFPTPNTVGQTILAGQRQPCNLGTLWFLKEFDIALNRDKDFIFDPNQFPIIPPGKFDVVYILAHEIGHAHMLQHVAEPAKMMYPAAQTGTSFLSRILNQADINGGLDVMQFNSSLDGDPICVEDSMEWFPPCAATNIAESLIPAWEIFPNPASEQLQLSALTVVSIQVTLLNMQGQRVGDWQLVPTANDLYTLNLPSGLSEGLYFLSIRSKQQTVTEKIIIRHE